MQCTNIILLSGYFDTCMNSESVRVWLSGGICGGASGLAEQFRQIAFACYAGLFLLM